MATRSFSQSRARQSQDISRLIQLNNENINSRQKQRIQSLLTQQAEYLLYKKERELLKKRKVKQLQEKYEKERQQKIKIIHDKISKSEVVRQNNTQNFQTKTKRKNQHFKKIQDKNSHNNEQSIQKRLELRRQFENNQIKNVNQSRISKVRTHNNKSQFLMKYNSVSVDQKIKHFHEKMHRAETNHEINNLNVIERAKNQSHHVQQIKRKAQLHKSMIQKDIVNHYHEQASLSNQLYLKNKDRTSKKCEDKRKSLQQKMKKCNDKLKHLDRQKQQRLDQKLRQKMQRKIVPKHWRNQKAQAYLLKFYQNAKKLQQLKYDQGQEILKKHHELSLINKTLKQRKDKIYKAIMLT